MNNILLLDTSAYAQLRRGHVKVVNLLATAERVFLSSVCLGELEAGFLLGSRPAENQATLRDFLAEPFVAVIDVNAAVARRYGVIFSQLRRAGTPIPTNDIWIAACALQAGAQIVTFDSDFDRIADLNPLILSV